jgi:hypothetical protein
VSASWRVVRRNSVVPTSSSSRATCWLTTAFVLPGQDPPLPRVAEEPGGGPELVAAVYFRSRSLIALRARQTGRRRVPMELAFALFPKELTVHDHALCFALPLSRCSPPARGLLERGLRSVSAKKVLAQALTRALDSKRAGSSLHDAFPLSRCGV